MGYLHKIMDELDHTEELLYHGLKEINNSGDLNASNLEMLGEILDGVKDLCEIKGKGGAMEEEYGYSSGRYRMYDGRSYGRSYDDGMSHGRYDNRYSGNEMLDDLRHKMNNAKSEQERETYRKLIREYEG